MKLPIILSAAKTKRGIIGLVVAVFVFGGASYVYFGRGTANINNASDTNTNKLENPISTTSGSKSGAGTISVPCGCQEKNKQTQPGQTSTPGANLQGGSSGSTQGQTCNPCSYGGSENAAMMCPEYLCKAPPPNPSPSPPPTPTPGCGTCGGGGIREDGTNSSMIMCPMYCVE